MDLPLETENGGASRLPQIDGANDAVQQAAVWLTSTASPPRPLVPYLRQEYALTALQACQAIELARRLQSRLEAGNG